MLSLCNNCKSLLKDNANYVLCSQCQPILNEIAYLQIIEQIESGNLPIVNQDKILLNSDEICYLDTGVIFLSKKKDIKGNFLATNRKCYFLSNELKYSFLWKNLLSIKLENAYLNLELTTKIGSGRYIFLDNRWTEAILSTVLKQNRRIIVNQKSSRSITQSVKLAVWQRDLGQCIECHATGGGAYLEFDHIIPVAKGGSNSENNVQLLCRKCNLKKGDRI